MITKVKSINQEGILFENNIKLVSEHYQDCCEHHYLSFDDLLLDDFDGLEFDLSSDKFFRRIPGYGIELVPLHGHSIRIPGYASNNGYYSSNLSLVLFDGNNFQVSYDISECQDY